MTRWTDERAEWVRHVTPARLLKVIASVAEGYGVDENGGDYAERAETILWLATRGQRGREWGHAGDAAREVGGWDGDA